ncbi:MAG: leucine-rich repeat protein, partial [Clostridia bacterium]|nr:leucine-rich repeat protein [Clostridia bacterium]
CFCGERETETIPAHGKHSFGEWVLTKINCLTEGLAERICSVCDKKETTEVPSNGGHTPGKWTVLLEATETEKGLKQQRCSVCDEITAEEEIPANGTSDIRIKINSSMDEVGFSGTIVGIGNREVEKVLLPKLLRINIMGSNIFMESYAIGNGAFSNCENLRYFELFDNLISIEAHAFDGCNNLESIVFNGTKAQWEAIRKNSLWNSGSSLRTVICTDGVIYLV